MYILGENPAMSDPDVEHAREALAQLDHLVVQDIFLTETANFADVILPASPLPRKNGTVTNTNRQVQMGRPALPPPGEAREDWAITPSWPTASGSTGAMTARRGLRRDEAQHAS
jgi:formate dehydrogenase major subunit